MEKIGHYSQVFSLHIPKTGGNSFVKYLTTFKGAGTIFQVPNNEKFLDHLDALNGPYIIHVHQFYPFSLLLKQPLLITVFLRDPIHRVVSAFEYIRRKEDHPLRSLLGHKGIYDLSAFCTHADFQFHAAEMQTRMLGLQYDLLATVTSLRQGKISAAKAKMSVRQHENLPADRSMLERAKLRLNSMSFFGLTEFLGDSLRLFATLFGGPQETSFWENAAPQDSRNRRHQNYRDLDLDAVRTANHHDVELYSFARDLFLTRYKSHFGHYPHSYSGG